MQPIQEHSVKLRVELPEKDVHKKMPVFYNPVMKSNRNLSILLLNSIPNRRMKIASPLAGSGVRELRFLNELKKGKIKKIYLNDLKPDFFETIKENLRLNLLENKKDLISLHNEDASLFLLHQEGFDYIDLDPFGSPNPFLAAALARLSRQGFLAVTATDTAALTGTYPKVTKRKYWAAPLRNYLMHELGLRILIRKVQLQGIQFDKALTPVLSYHKEHYFRIYFLAEKGKEKCDELVKQHQYFLFCPSCLNFKSSNCNKETCSCGSPFQFAGPLWAGKLFDKKLLKKMSRNNPFPEEQKFLNLLAEEAEKDLVGFYDLHQLANAYHLTLPKIEPSLKKLKGSRTHFSPTGIKTELTLAEVVKLIRWVYPPSQRGVSRRAQEPPAVRDS